MHTCMYFFISFSLGTLCVVLRIHRFHRDQTSFWLLRSWQTTWLCSGFQWNCIEVECPLSLPESSKAFQRSTKKLLVLASTMRKCGLYLLEILKLVGRGRDLQLVEGKSSQPADLAKQQRHWTLYLPREVWPGFWKNNGVDDQLFKN